MFDISDQISPYCFRLLMNNKLSVSYGYSIHKLLCRLSFSPSEQSQQGSCHTEVCGFWNSVVFDQTSTPVSASAAAICKLWSMLTFVFATYGTPSLTKHYEFYEIAIYKKWRHQKNARYALHSWCAEYSTQSDTYNTPLVMRVRTAQR